MMKVGIIGAGLVGSTTAYALINQGIGREIVLVDLDKERSEAEANDLRHAVPFTNPLLVHSGEYEDLAGARVVVISAGVSQKPDETRLELLSRNAAVFQTIIPKVLDAAPDAILLIATNPVDIMTHLAAKYAAAYGVPSNRVIGTGTTLDTARFRSLLGQHLGVDSAHVHAYVLGEHGDSEVVPFSPVTIGNIPLEAFCEQWQICLDDTDKDRIENQVRNAAYQIIQGKGATYYGVGSAIAKIVGVILGNQRAILTVCTPQAEVAGVKDVTLSLPQLVGGSGAIKPLLVPLTEIEQEQLKESAATIRAAIDSLEANHEAQ
jgi:L-lactate dehydrogenase